MRCEGSSDKEWCESSSILKRTTILVVQIETNRNVIELCCEWSLEAWEKPNSTALWEIFDDDDDDHDFSFTAVDYVLRGGWRDQSRPNSFCHMWRTCGQQGSMKCWLTGIYADNKIVSLCLTKVCVCPCISHVPHWARHYPQALNSNDII